MPRLGTFVVLLCLLLPGVAHAAAGEYNVTVVGEGRVTGSGGVDCPAVKCWGRATWTSTFPPQFTVTAHPPAGHYVVWEGCAASGNTCSAHYQNERDPEYEVPQVVATFIREAGPVLTLQAPLANQRFDGDSQIVAQVTATDDNDVDKVTFKLGDKTVTLDGPDFGTHRYRTVFASEDLTHGGHTIAIEATDFRNNKSTASIPIFVDKEVPDVAITGGVGAGAWHAEGPASITFSKGADVTKTECALTPITVEPAWGDCSEAGKHTAMPSSDGLWVFAVRVFDSVGNVNKVDRMFRVDTIDPALTIEGGAPDPVIQLGDASQIRAHMTEANSSGVVVECRVDEGTWKDCGNQVWQAEPNAAEGPRKWEFRAIDAAGNMGEASKAWLVDGTGPVITLADGPAEGAVVAPGTYGYRVSAEDAVTAVAGLLCAWNDGAFEACPFPGPTSRELTPGVHRLHVRAIDGVGNPSTVTRTFTVKAPSTDGGDKQPDGGGTDGGDTTGGGAKPGGDTTKPPSTTPPPAIGGGPRADSTAPVLRVSAPKRARSSVLRKGLALTVGCSEACAGSAAVSGPKGLKATAKVAGAGRVTLKLKPAALKKALRGRRSVKLTVTVSVTDAAGNAAVRKVVVTATA